MRRNVRYVVWLIVVAGVLAFTYRVGAQKAEQLPGVTPPRQWIIGLDWHDWEANYVTVVETTGVCLYVARSTVMRYAGSQAEQQISITAVAKTALPVGAGCQ